jgi:hypothetical protein
LLFGENLSDDGTQRRISFQALDRQGILFSSSGAVSVH